MELLKTIAEHQNENAAQVLAMLQAEDRMREVRRREEERRGYVLGGLITAAVGAGLSGMLALTKGGGEWAIGLIPLLIGVVLIGTGLRLPPRQ